MAEEQPSSSGGGSNVDSWASGYAAPSAPRPHTWPAMVVGGVGVLLGAAALVVALTRPTPEPVAVKAPTYTAAEIAGAQQQLCDTYKMAAQAAQVDTAGTDRALARISTSNGALLLEMAAGNPAVNIEYRDAARALAMAYGTLTAKGTYGVATVAEYQAALDYALAKDAVMKKICGHG